MLNYMKRYQNFRSLPDRTVERSETEGVIKVISNYKNSLSHFFCEKTTAPSKMGRKHELNYISNGVGRWMLISHSQTTAFSLFFCDIPHFVRRDIFTFAKVILRLRRSGILFASLTAARQYHSAESRISLRSNRTRRQANRTEKSTCYCKCFFLVKTGQ